MYNIQAIILDMDGTMFDSEKLMLDTIRQTLKFFGTNVSDDELIGLVGKSKDELEAFVESKVDNEDLEQFGITFKNAYYGYVEKFGTPIKKGLNNLIEYAKSNNLKLAIATSATRDVFDVLFDNSGLNREDFNIILTGSDVKNVKPDSEIYKKAVSELGLNSKECLVIEDSYIGATASYNAGCLTAMVVDLQSSDAQKDSMLNFKFYSLDEVVSFLNFNKIDVSFREEFFINEKEINDILKCKNKLHKYNKIPFKKVKKAEKEIRNIFAKTGKSPMVLRPFYCDHGINIEVGDKFFSNIGVNILDCGKVIFGNNCWLGPNVTICNVGHSFDPIKRIKQGVYKGVVYFGNNVWVGANATILQNIKIGDNAIIGAGSVVTHDVMPNTVVAGNPAKFIKFIM